MKRLFIFVVLATFSISCSRTVVKTGAISEHNRINITELYVGMTQDEVLEVMGYPYKTEEKTYQDEIYEVWYYITRPSQLGQSKLISRNFTPVIFELGQLKGWGRNFYKHTFDIDNERWKRKQEIRQKYTNDKEEWPRNEHIMIDPMKTKDKTKTSTSTEEDIPLVEPQDEKAAKPSKTDSNDAIDKTIMEIEKSSSPKTQQASKAPKQSIKTNGNAQAKKPKKTKGKKQTKKNKKAKKPAESEQKADDVIKTQEELEKVKQTDPRCRKGANEKDSDYSLWE